jgi:oligopeptide/dipeptide ABC transporter ATP-binding protein
VDVNSPTVPPLLEVVDLQVRYASGSQLWSARQHSAVAGVSFSVAPGESLGLVGESGSGKSSIARALLRLIPATGRILFQGRDLLRLSAAELRAAREHIQIVFQDPLGALDPRMTVAELVAEPLREFRPASAHQQRQLAAHMLDRVGLGPELLARYPHQLSGGQAQRVALARALMLGPQLLICDEPVAALDVSIKSQIANLLRDMRDELHLALLFIAHDLATVRYLCDRVMVLYQGRVMEIAPRAALYGAARHPYTRALLAANPIPDPSRSRFVAPIPGEAPTLVQAARGCVFRHRCPIAVQHCADETPPLRAVGQSMVACHRADE